MDPGRSGYSSLAVGRGENASAGWIYLFYEHDPFKGAHLARFNLSWLLGGESTGDGEIPKLKLDKGNTTVVQRNRRRDGAMGTP